MIEEQEDGGERSEQPLFAGIFGPSKRSAESSLFPPSKGGLRGAAASGPSPTVSPRGGRLVGGNAGRR